MYVHRQLEGRRKKIFRGVCVHTKSCSARWVNLDCVYLISRESSIKIMKKKVASIYGFALKVRQGALFWDITSFCVMWVMGEWQLEGPDCLLYYAIGTLTFLVYFDGEFSDMYWWLKKYWPLNDWTRTKIGIANLKKTRLCGTCANNLFSRRVSLKKCIKKSLFHPQMDFFSNFFILCRWTSKIEWVCALQAQT